MAEPDQKARDARAAWRTRRVQSDLDKAPDGLWHYTDAGGLQGILGGDELWATDTRFLNDATEVHYGLDVAEEAMAVAAASGRWKPETNRVPGAHYGFRWCESWRIPQGSE